MPPDRRGVEPAGDPCQFGREHQADRHGGAVPPLVTLAPLDGVRQGVPVVEDLPKRRFLLVGGDDCGLDRDRAPNQLRQHLPGRVDGGLRVGFDQVEDDRVGDEAGLDDFGHPRHQLIGRQGAQHRQIDQHRGWLMERADQVLTGFGVDSGLSADGGVDHRQQGGGNVHDIHAAQPGRRREACDVGRRSPAEADDCVPAVDTDPTEYLPDERNNGQILAGFGVGQLDTVRVNSLDRQLVTNQISSLGQGRLMQDRNPVT